MTIYVVVGGQFGSEGKEAISAWLGKTRLNADDYAVRVGGPDYSHTIVEGGVSYTLRHLPVVAATNAEINWVIGAGSEIDLQVLENELALVADKHPHPILYIDEEATVIESYHKTQEIHNKTSPYETGVSAARAARSMRRVALYDTRKYSKDTQRLLQSVQPFRNILIEGTGGYGLGTHSGYYPSVTSQDCRAIDFLAQAGLSPWASASAVEVWVVLRIPDQAKEWDPGLAYQAVQANGGPSCKVALSRFDCQFPELSGASKSIPLRMEVLRAIEHVENVIGTTVNALGTGPDTVMELV